MSIFSNPAAGAGKKFQQARNVASKNTDKAVAEVNVDPALKILQDQQAAIAAKGLTPQSMSGTGLGIKIDKNGNVQAKRSGEAQGWMNTIGQGLNTDMDAYGNLLSRLPGLSQVPVDSLEAAKSKAISDLQAQLGKRRVLGASFANDQVNSVAQEYDMQIAQKKYDALKDELSMTQSVINDRATTRSAAITQGLGQINYETGVAATLMANTQNNMMKLTDAQVDLAKTAAGISAQAAIARGDIRAGLTPTLSNTYSNNAQLQAEGKQAQNSSIGSVIGAGLGMFSFGSGGGAAAT